MNHALWYKLTLVRKTSPVVTISRAPFQFAWGEETPHQSNEMVPERKCIRAQHIY